jgi:hypothetical protein
LGDEAAVISNLPISNLQNKAKLFQDET